MQESESIFMQMQEAPFCAVTAHICSYMLLLAQPQVHMHATSKLKGVFIVVGGKGSARG